MTNNTPENESDDEFDDSSDEPWRADPATDRQKKKLKFFGIPIKHGLTKGEASNLITAAMDSHPETEDAYQANKEDEEALEMLEEIINDEDNREIGHYKKLTKSQLRQMLSYLSKHMPDWEKKSRFDLGSLVPRLFPEQAKIQRTRTPSSSRRVKPSGCLVLLLAPFVLICVVLFLHLVLK